MRYAQALILLIAMGAAALCPGSARAELMEGMSPPPNSWDLQLRYLHSDADQFCDVAGNNMVYPFGSFKGENHTFVVRPVFFGRKWAYHVIVPLMDTEIGGLHAEDSGVGDIVVGFARLYRGRKLNAILACDVKLKNGDYDMTDPASPGTNQVDFMPGIYLTRFHGQGMFCHNLALIPHWRRENKATGVKPGDYLQVRYTYGVAAGSPNRWWGLDFEGVISSRQELNGTPIPGSATRTYQAGVQYLQIRYDKLY